ncbi:MAG: MBL fold metallo-hydrolase [Xanthomonadaceae bacterium]|nr:MBL fold metallo-hydrolase [Xanthomonadaceae bacterium]
MVSNIRILTAGSCQEVEKVTYCNGQFKKITFPSSVAVIEHPSEGIILFDTGYSEHFKKATAHFPEKLYALVTPTEIDENTTAVAQLKSQGISVRDVRHIILSHLHADHVAGLKDFPHSKIWSDVGAFQTLKQKSRISRLRKAFLTDLIPADFEARTQDFQSISRSISISELSGDWQGHDLFGDESVIAIPLPGHALGHYGLFVRSKTGKPAFFLGDAAWLTKALKENCPPLPLAGIIMDSFREYKSTLGKLSKTYNQCSNQVAFIPCHCSDAIEYFGRH